MKEEDKRSIFHDFYLSVKTRTQWILNKLNLHILGINENFKEDCIFTFNLKPIEIW